MICPNNRSGALARLEEFLAIAPAYARDRNHVRPGHSAVSKLSPAIRHRLITEDEVAARLLAVHPLSRVEKFIQEVYWRVYWKSWLSLRPQVWDDHVARHEDPPQAAAIEAGCSGNALIDRFARELSETGYLHNHARMWVAAWWIHQARLPWQAGARWFFRHLLDGDPASNTLSWRWVAGLQTPGKTYLARRSNLEKYLDAASIDACRAALTDFENPSPHLLPAGSHAEPVMRPSIDGSSAAPQGSAGLWIHEEDLSPECALNDAANPSALCVLGHATGWRKHAYSVRRIDWLHGALADAASRAATHWSLPVTHDAPADLATALIAWAGEHKLTQILAMRPEIGPLHDEQPKLEAALRAAGIHLTWLHRERDLRFRPLATSGFFPFWEKVRHQMLPGDV
jgi:deoxyribodipyrimidine photo-lyase